MNTHTSTYLLWDNNFFERFKLFRAIHYLLASSHTSLTHLQRPARLLHWFATPFYQTVIAEEQTRANPVIYLNSSFQIIIANYYYENK